MKYVFAILLCVHGLIHLIGFVSAFFSDSIQKQTLEVSKPLGILWLLAFIFFAVSFISYVMFEKWFYIAFFAIIISQILILYFWNDTKFGTIANIIIFLVCVQAYGQNRFQSMVQQETNELLQKLNTSQSQLISEQDITHLPAQVQQWLCNSGVVGNERISSVHVKQSGKMKTTPNGKWLSFEAEQYFDVVDPAFIWSTKVEYMNLTNLVGRDKFSNGEGAMLIKLAGLIPVVDEAENDTINSASMLRYMAELVWFPSAAINEYMSWESIDEHKAQAIFTYKGKSVSGIFEFSTKGEVVSIEAQRYFSREHGATLETWFVLTGEYKTFDGYKIPTNCKVIWRLEEGDFNWLNFNIMDVNYNLI